MLKRWDPARVLRMVQDCHINMLTLVPTMYVHLLDQPDFDKYDLSSLKGCISGSAPLDPELGRKWKEKTGLDIYEGWGMSGEFRGRNLEQYTRPA